MGSRLVGRSQRAGFNHRAVSVTDGEKTAICPHCGRDVQPDPFGPEGLRRHTVISDRAKPGSKYPPKAECNARYWSRRRAS